MFNGTISTVAVHVSHLQTATFCIIQILGGIAVLLGIIACGVVAFQGPSYDRTYRIIVFCMQIWIIIDIIVFCFLLSLFVIPPVQGILCQGILCTQTTTSVKTAITLWLVAMAGEGATTVTCYFHRHYKIMDTIPCERVSNLKKVAFTVLNYAIFVLPAIVFHLTQMTGSGGRTMPDMSASGFRSGKFEQFGLEDVAPTLAAGAFTIATSFGASAFLMIHSVGAIKEKCISRSTKKLHLRATAILACQYSSMMAFIVLPMGLGIAGMLLGASVEDDSTTQASISIGLVTAGILLYPLHCITFTIFLVLACPAMALATMCAGRCRGGTDRRNLEDRLRPACLAATSSLSSAPAPNESDRLTC